MATKKETIENYWVTAEEIILAGPCKEHWPRSKIMNWFGKRKKVRLSTILFDRKIPEDDRLWIVTDVIYIRNEIPWDWWAVGYGVPLEKLALAIEW